MNFAEFYESLERTNPKLLAAKEIKISVKSLRRVLETTFEAGQSNAEGTASIFDQIFGK